MDADRRQSILAQFRRFDVMGRGSITEEELVRVLEHLDPITWTSTLIQKLLLVVPRGADGNIDFDVFLSFAFEHVAGALRDVEQEPSVAGEVVNESYAQHLSEAMPEEGMPDVQDAVRVYIQRLVMKRLSLQRSIPELDTAEARPAEARPAVTNEELYTEATVDIDFVQTLHNLPAGLQLPPYVGSAGNFLYDYAASHQERLCHLAAAVRILVHPRTLRFIEVFLGVKLVAGSDCERSLYRNMTPKDLILRLVFNRPAVFWQEDDNWCLKDGTRGFGGFESIGTNAERKPLVIRDLLSYDEMLLSALLSVSTPTPFFNKGGRSNQGRRSGEPYPFEGVYVGSVGARFEKPGFMEHALALVTPSQNTLKNGYGRHASGQRSQILRSWAQFYGRSHFPTWEEALQEPVDTYLRLSGDQLLDRCLFKARLRMTIEPFMLDANARGQQARKSVFVHVVGLGLGVWALDNRQQAALMFEVYSAILQEHALEHVSTINFSWFPEGCNRSILHHDRIRILHSQRDAAEPVGDDEILVAMYAWDSNAYPGNEYWLGALDASGDPAAACCSAISLLQNAEVNPRLRDVDSITVLPQLEAAPACASKIRLRFNEPPEPRYVHVSDNNVVLLMMPLVAGEEIGTDNTCQAVLEMQRFFGKRFNSDTLKDSAFYILSRYLRALRCDMRLLSMCGAALYGQFGHDTFWKKDARRAQVEAYIKMIAISRYDLDCLYGSYPVFPSAVQDLIKRSTNIFCMLLSPYHVDEWLRFPRYDFKLARSSDAAFGSHLRRCFWHRLQQDGPPPDPLLAHIFAGGLQQDDRPTNEKFLEMQQNLATYLTTQGQAAPTFSYTALQELTDILMAEFDTMLELVRIYISAENIMLPETHSHFAGVTDLEELTMMTQMFLGITSIHLKAYGSSSSSLGDLCEAHAHHCARQVSGLCYGVDPESVLLEWAANKLSVRLPEDKCLLVKSRFRAFWTTVKQAPHLDEFLLHFADLCSDDDSLGVSHQGCICIPYSHLEKIPVAEIEEVCQMANQEFCKIRSQLAEQGQHLRHENSKQVMSEPLEVDEDVLRRHAELASPAEAAEMLLMLQEDGTPLYRHFMRDGQEPLHHWVCVKSKILGMLHDQAELDSFSEWLQIYERTALVWLRITGFFARSLYTEATTTCPHAVDQLSVLSNNEHPRKLQRALQLLGVDLELSSIMMSEHFDGYNIHVTEEDREKLLEIHQRRRRNFHLTPGMARLLYQLVEHRHGSDSQAYLEMQHLDNGEMCVIPDPRGRGTSGADQEVIVAPRKIFQACVLLDIVIPKWEFNHYSGYLVSADSAVIDQLEGTVEWARSLLDGGGAGTRTTPRTRRHGGAG